MDDEEKNLSKVGKEGGYFCKQEKEGSCCIADDAPAICDPVKKMRKDAKKLEAAMQLVNKQINNPTLWYPADTASGVIMQQELRKLHEIIEGKSQTHCAAVAIGKILKEDN